MLVDLLAGVGKSSVLGLMQLSHIINTVLLVFWSVHQLAGQVCHSYRLQLG